ncbi:MAG: hypothetical protein AB8G14_03705 [Ilumatobacter sp.]
MHPNEADVATTVAPLLPSLPDRPVPPPPAPAPAATDPGDTLWPVDPQSSQVPNWKRRRNGPVRRLLRYSLRLACMVAIGYGVLWAVNWYVGDEFGTGPADVPNALEAHSVRFATLHPTEGGLIEVHADLVTRDGEATHDGLAAARRREADFVRLDDGSWVAASPEQRTAHQALFLAIDAAMVRTLDDVFPRRVWHHLEVLDQEAVTIDGPTFVAAARLDIADIGHEFSDRSLERAFPIPRLPVTPGLAPTQLTATRLTVEASGTATAGITPTAATRFGLEPDASSQLTIVVDDVGVVRSIDSAEGTMYALHDASVGRPTSEASTALGNIPASAPMGAAGDLPAMTRDAIGPRRFDRIVEHTGVTMGWGSVGAYDAKAYWNESGGLMTMNVRVAGFWSGKREDLLAHELAHIAGFGAGILTSGSHECLADIVASHWLGHKVEAGAYDYRHCATHGDAQRVLDIYG